VKRRRRKTWLERNNDKLKRRLNNCNSLSNVFSILDRKNIRDLSNNMFRHRTWSIKKFSGKYVKSWFNGKESRIEDPDYYFTKLSNSARKRAKITLHKLIENNYSSCTIIYNEEGIRINRMRRLDFNTYKRKSKMNRNYKMSFAIFERKH
jgi:hypothetical protein